MTNNTNTRTFPAHDLKPGDMIHDREIFDVIDAHRRKVMIKFTDGSFVLIASWTTTVEIDN